jgi:hypothetical protein
MQTFLSADLLSAGIKFTDELVDHIIGNILQKSLTTACKAMRIIERIATTGILLNELIAGADRLVIQFPFSYYLIFMFRLLD